MLTIRQEQFAVFEAQAMGSFLDRVIAFLREHFPDVSNAPNAELRPHLEPLVQKAKSYRLTTERQVVTYILAAKQLGGDFDQRVPEAKAVLNDVRLVGESKMQRLQALLG